MSGDKTDTVELATLGRPFRLGMLYDCRSDSLVPGITLWELNKIRDSIDIRSQRNTNFQVIMSDSIEEKASSLDVSASLKLSLLGGMISVKGSASYFNDSKSSKNQARITLQYRTTTRFEQLTMSQLGTKHIAYNDVFDQGTATHVVTGVLYGAQAFFVFDREIASNENKQTVQGSMEGAIKVMGLAEAEIKGSVAVSNAEKTKVDQIKCTFYGDFKLESNPVTFQEAIQVYSKLPNMLGPNEEHAVPIKVWLYPLKLLNNLAAKLVRDISVELVYRSQGVLEQLGNYEMQCNDLMKNEVSAKFHVIKRKARHFKELCQIYKLTFQKNLAMVLPQIRGGGKEERLLAEILERKELSPFRDSSLIAWLEDKETEKNVVKAYLTMMKDIRVLARKSELEEVILDPLGEYVLCLVFTSLHGEEPYLKELSNYLKPQEANNQVPETGSSGRMQEQWFSNVEVSQRMRKLAKHFLEFVDTNKKGKTKFLIASESNTAHPGVSVYLYEEGRLDKTDFQPPSKPDVPLVVERSHNSITLKLRPPKYGAEETTKYNVEYTSQSGQEHWESVFTHDNTEAFTVFDLTPHTKYQFRYKAVTKPGVSVTSDTCEIVTTYPASPPTEFTACEKGDEFIQITWGNPDAIGLGLNICNYRIEYKNEGEETWATTMAWKREGNQLCTFQIRNLMPNTSYTIRVAADCGEAGLGVPSNEVVVKTDRRFEFEVECTLIRMEKPCIYKLHLEEEIMDEHRYYKRCTLGEKDENREERRILLLGIRGFDKSTLINAMVNYILGVGCGDIYRFTITDGNPGCSEGEAETQWITSYEINYQDGFRIPYSLTIIDAPGYGEWSSQNNLIDEQIRDFFHMPGSPDDLNTICFVVESSLGVKSPPAIFQAFGRTCEIYQRKETDSPVSDNEDQCKGNIVVFTTCSENNELPVLKFVEEYSCVQNVFQFSKSGLFTIHDNEDEDDTQVLECWEITLQNVGAFFNELNGSRNVAICKPLEYNYCLNATACASLTADNPLGIAIH
ncbi:stonustoxin subunit alpha-like [Huso huso]|uniref:Stonustoxin subunit alpha-like n=1 Tax=Huso huso TaxID=61971 RepID=A0ABR0YF60_HUSHU